MSPSIPVDMTIPVERCAACGQDFAQGDEAVVVALRMPPGTELKEGVALMVAQTYHEEHLPTEEQLQVIAKEMWPS